MKLINRAAVLTAAAGLALVGTVSLGAASASASATTPQVSASVGWPVTPTVNGLRLRSGPSTHYVAYGLLYRGDHLNVTSTRTRPSTGQWFHVTLTQRSASGLRSGTGGWVYAAYTRAT